MISLTPVAQGLGLAGLFATRVFLPMFAAALMMRYGPSMGGIEAFGLLASVEENAAPTWFTHDITLIVLGVLAALELIAHKSPDARALLNEVDQYAKPVAAGLTYLGIATVADVEFIEQHMQQAGFGSYVLVLFIIGGTFLVASAHNSVLRDMIEMDDGDDTGLLRIFSWGQDLWAVFGIFFLILFPIVMFVLIAIAIGIVLLLQRRAAVKEEQSKIACQSCQQPMYRCAVACGHCGAANPQPTSLNWLGASTMKPTPDRQEHPMWLAAHRRCKKCGTRMKQRTPHQSCPTCQTRPFDDPQFLQAYDTFIHDRLGLALIVCWLLSTIPIIGLVPGVIFYRLTLVAPYRRYVGRGRSLVMRWFVRIIAFFLVMIQWIPGLGMITLPAMAAISHAVFRRAFHKQLKRGTAPTSAPAPAAVAT